MYCSTVYVKLLRRSNTLRKSTLLKPCSCSLLSRTYVVSQAYRELYFVEKSWLRLFTSTTSWNVLSDNSHYLRTAAWWLYAVFKIGGWLMTANAEWLHSTDAPVLQRVPPLASKHKKNLKCYSPIIIVLPLRTPMPASYLLQRLFLSQLRWNVLRESLGLMYWSTVYVKL